MGERVGGQGGGGRACCPAGEGNQPSPGLRGEGTPPLVSPPPGACGPAPRLPPPWPTKGERRALFLEPPFSRSPFPQWELPALSGSVGGPSGGPHAPQVRGGLPGPGRPSGSRWGCTQAGGDRRDRGGRRWAVGVDLGHKGSPKAEGVLGFVFLNNIPFLGEAARAAGGPLGVSSVCSV